MLNEPALTAHLAAQGFAILNPEQESPAHIAATLADADLIVAVEGSAFAHLVMAGKEGATWLAIYSPGRLNMLVKGYADTLGMRFAFAVTDDAGQGHFIQPIDRLDRLLDLLARDGSG